MNLILLFKDLFLSYRCYLSRISLCDVKLLIFLITLIIIIIIVSYYFFSLLPFSPFLFIFIAQSRLLSIFPSAVLFYHFFSFIVIIFPHLFSHIFSNHSSSFLSFFSFVVLILHHFPHSLSILLLLSSLAFSFLVLFSYPYFFFFFVIRFYYISPVLLSLLLSVLFYIVIFPHFPPSLFQS